MIKAAIIGLGWWGRTIARYLAGSERIRPVLGIDPDESGRAAGAGLGLKVSSRFEDALEDSEIGAIILCSPHKHHSEQIAAAANAGKHVFCEKPICTSSSEIEAAIAAVERAHVVLGIGHERRFEPAILDMRRRFSNGDFGDALMIEGNFSQDLFLRLAPGNWRLSPQEAPVGPLSATGIHIVDLAISFLGKPKEVWARLATLGSTFANGDTLSVTLGFESGATAMVSAMLATPFAGRFALFGSKGWMEIRDRTHPQEPTGWDVTTMLQGARAETRFYPPHPAVRDNLEAFACAALGEAAYPVSVEEMIANVQCFEAITRSAATRQIERI